MTTTTARVPAGISTGGRFAATTHAEPDISLVIPTNPEVPRAMFTPPVPPTPEVLAHRAIQRCVNERDRDAARKLVPAVSDARFRVLWDDINHAEDMSDKFYGEDGADAAYNATAAEKLVDEDDHRADNHDGSTGISYGDYATDLAEVWASQSSDGIKQLLAENAAALTAAA